MWRLGPGVWGWQWKPAIEGARKHCVKCAAMRGKWYSWDESTELGMYLYLRKEHTQILSEKWTTFVQEMNDEQAAYTTAPAKQALKRKCFAMS